MEEKVPVHIRQKLDDLQTRLDEAEQLIEAIKAGEVDAFAIRNESNAEIYTLQSGDYAYRVLIEELQEGAINVTEDGMIVYANPYFLSLMKLPYEKIMGSHFFEFVHEASFTQFRTMFKDCLSGKSKGEIDLVVSGVAMPVYVSLTSLQPKLPTVGMIITDLTQKKKNETIILEYQQDLEKKNIELIQGNAELASFAYIASHDLQEPLRKIQAFSGRILDKEFEGLTENAKDYFGRMQSAANRMQSLIEDLLTYSRTNTAERIFERTDIGKLVKEVETDLKDDLNQRQAVITHHVRCIADIIPFQFRQLLQNIILNALKFSKPDEPPRISIACEIAIGSGLSTEKLDPEREYFHLRISDNGIGFEQKYSEKIFELFQRLHGRAEYTGTGIGLAIVKKIVDNHHGFIEAKSALNEGATFDIYIPTQLRASMRS
jgi:PAS domain S-box-containing protein